MKKIIIAIAIIMTAFTAFGQISRYDENGNRVNAAGHPINQYNVECEPAYINMTEYFCFRINWSGAVLKNGKFEHITKSPNAVLRMRTDKGVQTARWLYNVNGELQEEPCTFHSFVAVDMSDGTKKGYFVVDYTMDGVKDNRGNGIPNATIRICGELKLKWNESKKHWESVSGDGNAVGWSDGGKVPELTESATWCAPSKDLLPIRARVTISTAGYWTQRQLLNMAPKK